MARRGLLTETAAPAKEILGVETIDAVADKGYFKIEDIEACENAGIVAYVPRPQRGPSVRAGLFRKDEFGYDADSDSYVCPAGQRLYPYSSSLLRGLKKVNYVNKLACDDCTIRAQCTRGPFRTVSSTGAWPGRKRPGTTGGLAPRRRSTATNV